MKNLLLFLNNIKFFVYFLAFQFVVLFVIQSSPGYQESKIVNSSASVAGWIYEKQQGITGYFNLKKENKILAEQNTNLKQRSFYNYSIISENRIEVKKDVYEKQYNFQPGEVIQNPLKKRNNVLTLNIGKNKKVLPEMGVLNSLGVVGFVLNTSPNYSTAMSMMNTNFRIPVSPKSDSCVGTLMWLPENGINEISVKGIPSYFTIEVGDTIVTQGGSGIFPKGENVGIVKKVQKDAGSNNHHIVLKTAVDFHSIQHIYVVGNIHKSELDSVLNHLDTP